MASSSSTILALTPELLGLVLSYDGVQHTSILLWITGNKLLQRHLALGVADVYLENTEEFALCCVPPILKEFRHLRKLVIDRYSFRVLFPSSATSTLRSLSPTLKKLGLYFVGATEILFPSYVAPIEELEDEDEENVEEKQDNTLSLVSVNSALPEPQEWSLKATYPRLEALLLDRCVWTTEMASELPVSLTKLSMIHHPDPEQFKALVQALPPHMEHLVFSNVADPPIAHADFMALLSRFNNLQTLEWHWTSLISDPDDIALLPRTLTMSEGYDRDVARQLSHAAIAQLPPALKSINSISLLSEEEEKPLFLDHLTELRSVADDEDPGLRFTVAAIKRLPRLMHTLNIEADLNGISQEDWPPNLTRLEWTPLSSNFSLSSLPPLMELLIQNSKITLSLDSFGELPRTLQSLRCTCGPIVPNVDIDFPPNLTWLNLQRSSSVDQWVVIEPQKVIIMEDIVEEEIDEETNEERWVSATREQEVELDPHQVPHLEAATHPLKVVSCFPFRCLPRFLTTLNLPCPIPASQLVHLSSTIDTLSITDIFEDVDFNPNDARCGAKLAEHFKVAKNEGIATPTSYCALPASVASLLPRTLTSLQFNGGLIWNESCDWRRLPPRLNAIYARESSVSVPATLFFANAPTSRLTGMHLPMDNFTDEDVKMMPPTLKWIHCSKWATRYSPVSPTLELTEDAVLHWPKTVDAYDFPDNVYEAWESLIEKRKEAIAASSIKDLCLLFPHCYLNKLYPQ